MLKPLTVWITTNYGKFFKRWEYQMGISPSLPPEKSVCRSKTTVTTGHGTTDWFKIGKEYTKAVYCHSAYLTSTQSTSCEIPSWMKHKLESSLLEKTAITSDMQMTPPYGRKQRGTKEPLDESERGE